MNKQLDDAIMNAAEMASEQGLNHLAACLVNLTTLEGLYPKALNTIAATLSEIVKAAMNLQQTHPNDPASQN